MIDKSFIQSGNVFFAERNKGNEVPALPPAIYTIHFSDGVGFYLERVEDFGMPEKTYGNNDGRAEKIINTFMTRENKNTGVLLSGNKGSGKTLLSKSVCVKLVEAGIPVLLVETAFAGPAFTAFINYIEQRCALFIDEFEKKYRKDEDQNLLLSLMDGTGVGNKMFLLTSNNEKVSEFLLSRPSRVFYHWHYGKLPEDVFMSYCDEVLQDKTHMNNLKTLLAISTDMSFDVLQSIVEELNRYPEVTFLQTLLDMNINFGSALNIRYVVESATWGGEPYGDMGGDLTVNLIDFQQGVGSVSLRAEADSFADIMVFNKSLKPIEFFHYCSGMVTKVEKGEVSVQEIEDNFGYDDDLRFNFRYDAGSDSVSTEVIVINRDIGGKKFTVVLKANNEPPIMKYMKLLFK